MFVGGCKPYLSSDFFYRREQVPVTEKYQKATRVVILTTREWRRLQRKAGERK